MPYENIKLPVNLLNLFQIFSYLLTFWNVELFTVGMQSFVIFGTSAVPLHPLWLKSPLSALVSLKLFPTSSDAPTPFTIIILLVVTFEHSCRDTEVGDFGERQIDAVFTNFLFGTDWSTSSRGVVVCCEFNSPLERSDSSLADGGMNNDREWPSGAEILLFKFPCPFEIFPSGTAIELSLFAMSAPVLPFSIVDELLFFCEKSAGEM